MEALDKIEQINVQPSTNRPLKPIKLFDVAVFKNPFDDYQAKLAKKLEKDANVRTGVDAQKRKREERDKDRTTWFGTALDEPVLDSKLSTEGLGGVGKYLKADGAPKVRPAPIPAAAELEPAAKKKRKGPGGGFGDFSGW
jgi:peptidyl-prolyl cis-trans isomerase-like protein 2